MDQTMADAAIGVFLLAQPAGTPHSDLVRRISRRFGSGHGWAPERIRAFLLAERAHRPGIFRVERDPEILAFVQERIPPSSLDALRDACLARFGARAPSRSALGRYVQRQVLNAEAQAKAERATPPPPRRSWRQRTE